MEIDFTNLNVLRAISFEIGSSLVTWLADCSKSKVMFSTRTIVCTAVKRRQDDRSDASETCAIVD